MTLDELSNQLDSKKQELKDNESILKQSNAFISEMFKINSGVPEVTYNDNLCFFRIDYTDISNFKGNESLCFKLCLVRNKINVISNIVFQNNNYQLNEDKTFDYIENFYKQIKEIKELFCSFEHNNIIPLLEILKSHKKKQKNTKEAIEVLENAIVAKNNEGTFNLIERVIPSIKFFCIDSFLCDKYNIDYIDKPNRKDIALLKEKVNKGLEDRNDAFLQFEFLLKKQNGSSIEFPTIKLHVYENCELYLYTDKVIKTKKGVNNILLNQFLYKKELMTPDKALYSYNFTHLVDEYIDIEEFKNVFLKEAVKENVENF